jgi:hypothetical protein
MADGVLRPDVLVLCGDISAENGQLTEIKVKDLTMGDQVERRIAFIHHADGGLGLSIFIVARIGLRFQIVGVTHSYDRDRSYRLCACSDGRWLQGDELSEEKSIRQWG